MIRASRYATLRLKNVSNSSSRCHGVHRFSSSSSSSSSSLIPARNLWDTIYSGTKGLISLLVSEESRQKFMDIVQGSTINADVLKQARFGSMLTIALFEDLQNPLFELYSFNAKDFLTGVQPALTNFHDTLGQLQNEFPEVTSKEEQAELLMERFRQIATTQMNAAPESPWTTQAQDNPESAAGRLSAMVSPRLFNSLFLTTETEAMMSKYKEGTTKVSYVALLSARAMVMEEEEGEEFTGTNESPTVAAIKKVDENEKMEATKNDNKQKEEEAVSKMENKTDDKDDNTRTKGEEENVLKSEGTKTDTASEKDDDESTKQEEGSEKTEERDLTPVAAQIEVLYEMNQTVDVKPLLLSTPDEDKILQPVGNTTKDETQIWVGTFEGWLNGGPDGTLRWRITHLRPPHAEFPGLYHSTFRS